MRTINRQLGMAAIVLTATATPVGLDRSASEPASIGIKIMAACAQAMTCSPNAHYICFTPDGDLHMGYACTAGCPEVIE
jgi:hypothetical protein